MARLVKEQASNALLLRKVARDLAPDSLQPRPVYSGHNQPSHPRDLEELEVAMSLEAVDEHHLADVRTIA